jgi:hypothetical protein
MAIHLGYQRAKISFTQHCCRQGQSPFLETRIGLFATVDIPVSSLMIEHWPISHESFSLLETISSEAEGILAIQPATRIG